MITEKKKFSLSSLFTPLAIVALSMTLAAVLILVTGGNPILAYAQIFMGAFGSLSNVINTINKAVPICFAGFAVAISSRAGLFNIGVEGQLVFGAFGCALAGMAFQGMPPAIHIPLALLSGMLFGVLYAVIPTALYIWKNVNLIVVFIMMNNIVNLLITYFVNGPFAGDNKMVAATNSVQNSAKLPYLITKPNKLTVAIFIVLAAAVVLWFYMEKTISGYKLRAIGGNRLAARYAGLPVRRYLAAAILMSGAMAGLAGSVEVLGTYHQLYDKFSPGYGFDGIPIAILANGNPFGVVVGGLLFGALRVGSIQMQAKAGISSEIVSVIQGSLITLIACQKILNFAFEKIRNKKRALSNVEKEAAVCLK